MSDRVRTSDDLDASHWMARQLPAGVSLRPYAEDEAKSVLTAAVQTAIQEAGLTRAEVADLLGVTKSRVSQLLNGSANMTLRSFGALLWAAGKQVDDVRVSELGSLRTAFSPAALSASVESGDINAGVASRSPTSETTRDEH